MTTAEQTTNGIETNNSSIGQAVDGQGIEGATKPMDAVDGVQAQVAQGPQFKVGWSYDVFLRKNGLPPSTEAVEAWRELSRKASKAQVALIAQLSGAGAKTKCSQKAVFNKRDGRWDTALTARVVQPGCKDGELVMEAILKGQQRAAKALSEMRQAAARMGFLPDAG